MSDFFYIPCFAEMLIGCLKAPAESDLRNDVIIASFRKLSGW